MSQIIYTGVAHELATMRSRLIFPVSAKFYFKTNEIINEERISKDRS